ncbi:MULTISPECIES: phosphotransferase family protein [Bradyrhizobium]|jgi:aminoglycoside phosphotransferase (APT) family kinase protein|nr:aminoglycoside phosphotransferase family protein [Bradyrhizobium denitrificans]MCL8489273.1 aminoglycoside phosphotransferase family protein [Bradyrhizobium denitrificans]
MSPIVIKPDLAIDLATAGAVVARTGVDGQVASISVLYGGEISAVYELALAGGLPPLVLKIYPDSMSWKMRKEARLLDLVRDRLPVPAPRLHLADASRDLIGLDYVVMSRLVGDRLGPLEQQLPPPLRQSAFRQVGRLSRAFHDIAMEAFGYIGPDGVWTAHADNRTYLTVQFDRKLTEFSSRGGAPDLALRIARHVEACSGLFEACAAPVLCHNDLHPGNILARADDDTVTLTGVVDFEGALAGDPLKDVAKALYYLSAGQREAFLEGYGPMTRTEVGATLDIYRLLFSLELWCWYAQFDATDKLAPLIADMELLLRSQ